MSTTNYWNKLSGDSTASPWNQDNWAAGAPAQVPGTNPWLGGGLQQPDAGTMYEGGTPNWTGGNIDWWKQLSENYVDQRRVPMNDDRNKADERWGQQGFSDAGVGYWSGGRPGAGSWVEQLAAAATSPVAAPAPAPAAPTNDMVPGAMAQQPYMINNVKMSGTEPLSNWYLKEQAQEQTPVIPNVSNWGGGSRINKKQF